MNTNESSARNINICYARIVTAVSYSSRAKGKINHRGDRGEPFRGIGSKRTVVGTEKATEMDIATRRVVKCSYAIVFRYGESFSGWKMNHLVAEGFFHRGRVYSGLFAGFVCESARAISAILLVIRPNIVQMVYYKQGV